MIAAFDHPILSGLLGDEDMAAKLGIEAELSAMLHFERSLAEVEGALGVIPPAASGAIVNALSMLKTDMRALKDGVVRDGVVVPEFVSQIRRFVGEPYSKYVHFGATSQDVIDTALVLRASACLDLLAARLGGMEALLNDLDSRFGSSSLMGRTRMQPAAQITVADRINSWRAPTQRNLERLPALRKSILVLQFGGAAGTLDALGEAGKAVRDALAKSLGLGDPEQWHSQRDRMAELSNWLSLVTGGLGKLGQDVTLMAQAGEVKLIDGGKSSAMPHKHNPIAAEVLVALARFNAVQLAGMHQSLVHEQERSGAAWTLEWMILPQMLMAAGASSRTAERLIRSIRSLGSP